MRRAMRLTLAIVATLSVTALLLAAPVDVAARRHHQHLHPSATEPVGLSATENIVPVNDPSWFWSPYNWNVQPASDGGLTTQSNNPGAFFKTSFTGASFVLLLNMTSTPSDAYMTLRWSVDNMAWQNILLPNPFSIGTSSITLASGLPNTNPDGSPHSLVLFVLNSHQLTDRWLTPTNVVRIRGASLAAGAKLMPYPFLFSKRILVYWDSIGEGVKVLGRGNPQSDLTDNDSTRNWVQVLGQSLQAEVGAVCFGAQGYLRDGSFHALMNVINDTEASFGWSRFDSHSSRLDSAGLLQPPPDYIVNGHGTNDKSFAPADVTAAATAWLHAITKAAPTARVFLTIPFGQFQAAALQAAYNAYQQRSMSESESGSGSGSGGGARGQGQGNPLVHLVDLKAWNAQEGISAGSPAMNRNADDGLHPLAWRSEQLGGFLATAIAQQIAQRTAACDDDETMGAENEV